MIDKHIVDFNENLIALRDFVELIDPFLNEKYEEHDKEVRPVVLSAMLDELLENKVDWEENEKQEALSLSAKIKEELATKYSEQPEVIIEKEVEHNGNKSISFKIRPNDESINKHIINAKKTTKHIELLYTNSLISTLSSVEWYFSQLLHFYYDKHPDSAGVQKRTMTLAELKTFDSVTDAEKHLVDVKIEEILRGNFESWVTLLKNELGLGLSYLDKVIDELVEIYQRRNLFVHNGGVVNTIYISKVKKEFRSNLQHGDKINVKKEYLDTSIHKLQKAFILIGAELWKKLDPNDSSRDEVLTQIVYENLLYSRWEIAEGISYFLLKDNKCTPVDRVLAQLNFWLCKKEQGRFQEIENDIMKADFSDKKEIFQLGLFSLQGNIEKFFEVLPIALDSNQVNIDRLEEFPIFREIRNSDRYKNFKESSEYFREENREIERLTNVEKDAQL